MFFCALAYTSRVQNKRKQVLQAIFVLFEDIIRSDFYLTVFAATSGNLVIQVQHGFSLKKN